MLGQIESALIRMRYAARQISCETQPDRRARQSDALTARYDRLGAEDDPFIHGTVTLAAA